MKDYNKLFNEKMAELLKDVPFEHELLGKFDFNQQVLLALLHNSDVTLDCSIDEFENVGLCASGIKEAFMPEMFIALKAVQTILPKDSGVSISNWIGFKRNYKILAGQWDIIAQPFIKIAQEYVNEEAKNDARKAKGNGIAQPLPKKIIKLS